MIEIFGPIFNDIQNIVLSIPVIDHLTGFTAYLDEVLGPPFINIAIMHSDNSVSGLSVVNPVFIFAGILACIGVYSVFKIIGVFLNSL